MAGNEIWEECIIDFSWLILYNEKNMVEIFVTERNREEEDDRICDLDSVGRCFYWNRHKQPVCQKGHGFLGKYKKAGSDRYKRV